MSHMTATNEGAPQRQPQSMPSMARSAIGSLIDPGVLKPGDEYIVEWADGERQRYRVEEIRGDSIVRRRWIEHRARWTEWVGVMKLSEIRRHTVFAAH